MTETWVAVKGYENIYEVSNLGQVKSSENKVTFSKLHGKRVWKQRVLKQKTDRDGYKRVTLWKDKEGKVFLVHRIVVQAFLKKIEGKTFINHKDGNPSNNHIENLEWCDYKDNLEHAYKNDLNKTPDHIVLVDNETKQPIFFISKARASRFLNRSPGYISACLKKGINKVDKYIIYTTRKDT